MKNLLLAFSFIVLICCLPNQSKSAALPYKVDSLSQKAKKDSIMMAEKYKKYHYFIPSKKRGQNYLLKKYGEDGLNLILNLNRIDKYKADTLIVPDTLVNNILVYAPFPNKIDSAFDIPKLLIFSQKIQAFGGYEYGNLVFWGPTSMGKKSTPTPNGLFHTNWKAKSEISTDNPDWILNWYFNIVNKTGVSLHQFELPGYPASHSCARLLENDAHKIYTWAEQWILSKGGDTILAYGTPVIIFGDYNQPKIWRNIVKNYDSAVISNQEMIEQLKEYRPLIIERQNLKIDYLKKMEEEKAAVRDLKK